MTKPIQLSSSSYKRQSSSSSVDYYTSHSHTSDNVRTLLTLLTSARVIAEVIGGILLGPTAFGRIPNFTNTIFPSAAMPNFNLIANVGLILFLFIVGLEVDLRIVKKNAKVATSVGAASLALPFAMGCLVAHLLYREYSQTFQKDNFGIFLLFIGTAFSITAFPVLARILTELKLLRTNVGVTVLSAGVGNDVVGWILLALTIALVNASSGLTAFYVILLVIAWTLILFMAVKPAYRWCLRRSSMSSGPSNNMMTLTILLVLVSAFYTEIIGVHPIFGAFLVGLIIPHDDGYAVALTDKIEDLVSVFFLPLYFASSGLKTNIGLLNTGKAWGYTIMVIITATISKVVGSTLAARYNGFLWRESGAVGILMSCKGLVELIVLNVGLSAGILTTQLFTMFVIMALVTTFITTPITMWFYPTWYQTKVQKWRAGEIDWEGNVLETDHDDDSVKATVGMPRLAVVIHRVEGLAPLLQFTHFLSGLGTRMHLIRTVEMTDRLSQIIKVSETADLVESDSLISIFRTYSRLLGVRLSYAIETLDLYDFPHFINQEHDHHSADLVIIPWIQDLVGGTAGNEYVCAMLDSKSANVAVIIDCISPAMLHKSRHRLAPSNSVPQTPVKHERMSTSHTTSANQPVDAERAHLYFPIFAYGPDEILGLKMLEQFLANDRVTASIVYFRRSTDESADHEHKGASAYATSVSDTESEISKIQTKIPSATNLTFDVVECQDTLEQSLLRQTMELQKGPLTTVLAHTVSSSLNKQISKLDKSTLSSSYHTFSRGELVEVYAGQSVQECGRLCVVSAK